MFKHLKMAPKLNFIIAVISSTIISPSYSCMKKYIREITVIEYLKKLVVVNTLHNRFSNVNYIKTVTKERFKRWRLK